MSLWFRSIPENHLPVANPNGNEVNWGHLPFVKNATDSFLTVLTWQPILERRKSMADQSQDLNHGSWREDPMTLKQLNRSIDDRLEACPTAQMDGEQMIEIPPPDQTRPDPRRLFHARWNRNKPGFQFLADH